MPVNFATPTNLQQGKNALPTNPVTPGNNGLPRDTERANGAPGKPRGEDGDKPKKPKVPKAKTPSQEATAVFGFNWYVFF